MGGAGIAGAVKVGGVNRMRTVKKRISVIRVTAPVSIALRVGYRWY
jgi:hypothetical protein